MKIHLIRIIIEYNKIIFLDSYCPFSIYQFTAIKTKIEQRIEYFKSKEHTNKKGNTFHCGYDPICLFLCGCIY